MKKYFLQLSLILVLMLLQISCVIYAQGQSVISDSIYSNILNEGRSIKVVLPEEYKPGSTDKYEVIYLTDGECVMLCVSRLTIRKTYTTELLTQEV